MIRRQKSAFDEQIRFERSLERHRAKLEQYRERWDYNNVSSRIPTACWPYDLPDDDEINSLRCEMRYCLKGKSKNDYCHQMQF
mmetsp:Transcript_59986/g.72088  ORF Transcript_59986/g.72088 Transcript_59986/m.72088 type:complete len:83 (-) Transcript_59986:68-316(-)